MYLRCLWVLSGLLWACESIVEPKLGKMPALPVIDAWLTGDSEKSYLRMSLSTDFENSSQFEPISNATAWLESKNNGRTYPLTETFRPGEYLFVKLPPVLPGSYKLTINWKDTEFTAEDQAVGQTILDSIFVKPKFGVPTFEDGFYVSVVFNDSANQKNFYLWKLTRNSKPEFERQINLLTDQRFDGRKVKFEIPMAFSKADTVEFAIYPLSQQSYQYYLSLKELVNSGSPILTPPNNPPSNIKGRAIGYFCVSIPSKIKTIVL